MIGKIIIVSLLIMIDAIVSFPAKSQDNRWVDELMNSNNNRCCYDNDGRRLTDPDWDTLGKVATEHSGPSGYRVYEDGKWHEVPNWAVVTQRNKDGIARVWWTRDYNEGNIIKTVICFLPGTLG